MSANVELVRSIFAAWDRGDFSSSEWAHPEVEYKLVGAPDVSGSWKGVAGMTEAWRRWLSPWEDFRTEVEEYRELDDERVLVLSHWTGRGKTSGLELGQLRTRAATLFHVRDNKVTKIVGHYDRDQAFADLGLASETDSELRSRAAARREKERSRLALLIIVRGGRDVGAGTAISDARFAGNASLLRMIGVLRKRASPTGAAR